MALCRLTRFDHKVADQQFSAFRLKPLWSGSGSLLDIRGQAPVQFCHQRSQILDNLLPTLRISDWILHRTEGLKRYRDPKRGFESDTKTRKNAVTLRLHVPTSR